MRANGLVQSAQATARIAGPLLAGILVTLVSLPGVLLVDFATFLFAVAMLVWVAIPGRRRRKVRPRPRARCSAKRPRDFATCGSGRG